MPDPLYWRKSIISVGTETTKGTSNYNGTAFTGLTFGANIEPDNLLPNTRMPDGHYQGEILSTAGPQTGHLRFTHQIRHGDGYLTLLTGCGYEVPVATYVPTSDLADQKCLSFRNWNMATAAAALRKRMKGCMGTGTLTFEFGGILTGNWDFTGVWEDPELDSSPPSLAPVITVTNFTHASTFTINTVAPPKCSRITINLNNEVSVRPDMTTSNRVLHAYLKRGAPTIEFDFEAHLIADWDTYGLFQDGTAHALNLVLTDGTNTLTITAPKMQHMEVRESESGPSRIRTTVYKCAASSGDDELTFAAG